MIANKTLNTFFEENFGNSSLPYLLYKDKQLLKEKNYKDFAEEQIRKTGKIYLSFLFALIYGAWYGVTNLIEYGQSEDLYDLSLGITALLFMVVAMYYSTKEYYTVKSSMEFFIKLLEENEKQDASSETT